MGTKVNDRQRYVALCTSRVYDPQIHGFIVRMNERLRAEGFSLLIYAINSDIYWEEDRRAAERYVFELIPYERISAVIIMDERIKSRKISERIITRAAEKQLPVVIVDGTYGDAPHVIFDYEKGFEKIVRHVIEFHGVRRPHMMAGHKGNEFSDRRIEVFRRVLEENGIEFDDSMISHGDFWSDPCRVATRKLLQRPELPEAIICANDVMAITVTEVMREKGLRAPDDIRVTGFDGYEGVFFNEPKISTAACDQFDLAECTLKLLFEALDGRSGPGAEIVAEPVLVTNSSCGCNECSLHPQVLQNWFKESFSVFNDDNRVLQMTASSMQTSRDAEELRRNLDSYKTDNTIIYADPRCLDDGINYFTDEKIIGRPGKFVLVYDPENTGMYPEEVYTSSFNSRLEELSQSGYPLIFNSLDFLDKPFGYICYFFRDYEISNYGHMVSITNSISLGIGGYVSFRYQRTLISRMDAMYRHDALTGLYNRVGFQNRLAGIIESGKYEGSSVKFIMTDLDNLKHINDSFGHAEGDNAIRTVAMALAASVPEESLSTRFGGDEVFSVILEECDADSIIKAIDDYLDEYNKTSGKSYSVTASCGYTQTVLDGDFDIVSAVREADEQMYKVKKARRKERGLAAVRRPNDES